MTLWRDQDHCWKNSTFTHKQTQRKNLYAETASDKVWMEREWERDRVGRLRRNEGTEVVTEQKHMTDFGFCLRNFSESAVVVNCELWLVDGGGERQSPASKYWTKSSNKFIRSTCYFEWLLLLLLLFDVVLTLRIKRFKGERWQKAIGDQLICKFYANLSLYLYIVPVTTLFIFFTDSCGFFSLFRSCCLTYSRARAVSFIPLSLLHYSFLFEVQFMAPSRSINAALGL